MTLPLLLAIAAAGGVGTIVRFLAGTVIRGDSARATLAVNLVASFAAGFFSGLLIDPRLVAVLVTGFCGGLSTYSAFAVRTAEHIEQQRSGTAFGNVALTLVGGAAAAWAGVMSAMVLSPAVPILAP